MTCKTVMSAVESPRFASLRRKLTISTAPRSMAALMCYLLFTAEVPLLWHCRSVQVPPEARHVFPNLELHATLQRSAQQVFVLVDSAGQVFGLIPNSPYLCGSRSTCSKIYAVSTVRGGCVLCWPDHCALSSRLSWPTLLRVIRQRSQGFATRCAGAHMRLQSEADVRSEHCGTREAGDPDRSWLAVRLHGTGLEAVQHRPLHQHGYHWQVS
jgi:hypothetical protein